MDDRGLPAIRPRKSDIPAFAEQDVREYFSRGGNLGPKITAIGQPTVARAVLTTIQELDAACGEHYFAAIYPPELAIYYVQLTGTFRYWGPPSTHACGVPHERDAGYVVLDARTGNALFMGTGTRGKWP